MSIPPAQRTIACIGIALAVSMMIAGTPQTAKSRSPEETQKVNWLEFDTDACGQVTRVRNGHSAAKSFVADQPYDWDDEDEDDWVNAWNMSPEESEFLNDWLSQHPEIATVTSAVEKSCDDENTAIDDSDETEIA